MSELNISQKFICTLSVKSAQTKYRLQSGFKKVQNEICTESVQFLDELVTNLVPWSKSMVNHLKIKIESIRLLANHSSNIESIV